ncbi:polyprenyl synthetase family protein [candidate division KSB1 bacterium]|nr:polyprenyl synthetase family protein [candidate division KSB1 bacterium]
MSEIEYFKVQLQQRAGRVRDYILAKADEANFVPHDIKEAVCHYFLSGGKMLRPGVLLFACGAVGGDEAVALPAAAAVEIFHTWTLVHDDIIDRDEKRRGQDTVHTKYYLKSLHDERFGFTPDEARHFGTIVGILAGDTQHGWSISLLSELSDAPDIDPRVTLYLIKHLDSNVLNSLLAGEMLDILYSKNSFESLNESLITEMLWRKTGALYEFAGKAGAMIGLNSSDPHHPYVEAIASFTSQCGIAFQLQDDILGIIGDEEILGKPVGSDIREGKKTIIVYHALKNATPKERKRLNTILGSEKLTQLDIEYAVEALKQLGGIEQTKKIAENYILNAQKAIEGIPDSKYKQLLLTWADYLVNREF